MKKTKFLMWILIIFSLLIMDSITNGQLVPMPCQGCWWTVEEEQILNNIATVIPWMDWTINILTLCGHDYNSDEDKCITMMDRNLWATSNDILNSNSFGNYYEWGNNYAFPSTNFTTGGNYIDCSSYSRENPLIYSTFSIYNRDYCSLRNDSLWWWLWDSSWNNYDTQNPRYQRQWPCDTWYHVPSKWEWVALMDLWAGESVEWHIHSNYFSEFTNSLMIPTAGYLNAGSAGFLVWEATLLWSSSPSDVDNTMNRVFTLGMWTSMPTIWIDANGTYNRVDGIPVRCFRDSALIPKENMVQIEEIMTTTIWETVQQWLPILAVTTNTINQIAWKQVLWEVNVDFWTNETVTFSHPVEVNIPVSDLEQVYVKVKHWWDTTYGFAWLTTNSGASCSNWEPTSNQYNWETINVVDWYATIYSCAASSFIALGVEGPSTAQIILSVEKWILRIWNTDSILNLWEVNVSNNAQLLSWSFWANSFWVEDMKWLESWYYTTIQVTDLAWTVAGHTISASNVSLKTENAIPSYISWATVNDSQVIFWEWIKSWHSGSWAVNYFMRENTSTANAWRVWKWWDNLQIKVNIPAHTPYDTYRWTITYTLYDLDS